MRAIFVHGRKGVFPAGFEIVVANSNGASIYLVEILSRCGVSSDSGREMALVGGTTGSSRAFPHNEHNVMEESVEARVNAIPCVHAVKTADRGFVYVHTLEKEKLGRAHGQHGQRKQ